MKIYIPILIILNLIIINCFNECEDEMVQIDYNKTTNYTVTVNNAVGPTSNVSLRSGFDCGTAGTTLNDTNCRFFSKDGSSGGDGTYADPYDTLEDAVTEAINDGVDNVACLDSEEYTDTKVEEALPDDMSIVAADGQTPTLTGNSTANYTNTYVDLATFKVIQLDNGVLMMLHYATTVSTGVTTLHKSLDGGVTWTDVSPAGSILVDIIAGTSGRFAVADRATSRIRYSDDNGASFTNSATWTGSFVAASPGKIFAQLGTNNYVVVANTNFGFSTNNLATFSISAGSVAGSYIMGLSPSNDKVFVKDSVNTFKISYYDYTFSTGGFLDYYWTNGELRELTNGDIFGYQSYGASTSPLFWRSTDGGTTFNQETPNLPYVAKITFSGMILDGDRIYIGIYQFGSTGPSDIYYSDDFGYTWTILDTQVDSYKNIVIIARSTHGQDILPNGKLFYKKNENNKTTTDGFIYYKDTNMFMIDNDNFTLNGFNINANLMQYIMRVRGGTSTTVRYCNLYNTTDKIIKDPDSDTLIISNSLLGKSRRGV